MNCKNKTLFFVLFIFKEFLSSQSVPAWLFQYDITKVVDQWFNKLFSINPNINRLRESFTKAQRDLFNVTYELNGEIKPFETKLLFINVDFKQSAINVKKTSNISQITWNKPQNKICAVFNKLQIAIKAKLRAEYNETGNRLSTTLHFRNFTLCGISSLSSSTKKRIIDYDISYSNYFLRNFGYERENIEWSGEEGGNVALNMEEITQEIESALITMLRTSIKRNTKLYQAFDTIFDDFTQINEDTSTINSFINQEPKYYYVIPRIKFHHFTLNVVIYGLLNIESLKINTVPDIFTRTLLVKHLKGNLVLDYGSCRDGAPAPMKLNFKIDYLSLSTNHEINCAHIEAKCFEFNSTKGPLNYRQSSFLLQRIESAIVSAIMPSKRVWKLCNIESPIDEPKNIVSTSKPNWESIIQTYKDWIPFPDDEGVEIKIAK